MQASAQAFTSDRKAEANRANAQKSTGPQTCEGKLRSAGNSRVHGLCASAATLLAQPNQELDALLTGYRNKLRPGDVQEHMLVRELAAADFRIQQIDQIQIGLLAYQMQLAYTVEEPEEGAPQLAGADRDTRTMMMGAAWISNTAAFALLIRYRGQATRGYYKALNQLSMLRTGKAGYLPEQQTAAAAKPAPPEPKPAPPPPEPAAKQTRQKDETNPTVLNFELKWDKPKQLYIPTLQQLREIGGLRPEEYDYSMIG